MLEKAGFVSSQGSVADGSVVFECLPDPHSDPLVREDLAPDPSISKQKYRGLYI